MVTETRKRRQLLALKGSADGSTTQKTPGVVRSSEHGSQPAKKAGSKTDHQPGQRGTKLATRVKPGTSTLQVASAKGTKRKINNATQPAAVKKQKTQRVVDATVLEDGRLARYQKRYRYFPSDCVPGKEWAAIPRNGELVSKKIDGCYVENFVKNLLAGAVGMDAIRHFVQQAENNSGYVDEYLRAGGTLQPLVDMLGTCEKESLTDIADMLHIIHYVLIKALVYDETQNFSAIHCARYLMSDYQPVIVRLLRDKGDQAQAFKTSAFRILKAIMLADSQAHGWNVLKLMNVCLPELEMHKCRESIVRQDGVVQVSLRTAFIEFNLTFLVDTPPEVVRLWLTRPRLITPLIQNLVYDSADNVILLMRSLRQYVLECANIDKYIYRTVFTTDLLKSLVNTYEWVGPEREVPTEEKQNAVLSATEEVVLPLLTSKRYFLVPRTIDLDRASPRHKHILLALKNSQLHAHQRRLVLRLFETCPEVLPAVLENYGGLLKTKLVNNRELLVSILKLHKPEEIVAALEPGAVTAKALSNFVVKSTLPRTALEYVGVAIKRKDNIAFCLEMLAIMIARCEQYLQLIERARTVDRFGIKKLKFDAINQILALFPNVDVIIAALEQHRNDRSVLKTNVGMEYAMDILLVCIRSFRAYIDSSAFITNFRNILQPAYRTPAQELYYINYELKAIKVVIALEPQSVSFDSPQFLSVLKLMVKIYINVDQAMRQEATELLLALFRNTTLFGNRTTEIEFWFQALFDLPNRAIVPELVTYLGTSARQAAQKISQQSTTSANHSLIDEAFEEAGERNDDLEELFARIEQEDGEGQIVSQTASADVPLELPVTDNFFLYMFARDRKHPEKYARYFEGVVLRYLHYLPHPEIVEKALPAGSSDTSNYVRGWMSGNECALRANGGWGVLGVLSKALVAKSPKSELFPKSVELNAPKKNFRPKLVHMLHLTTFYLSRLVAAKKLTQEHLDVIAHYTDVLLSALLDAGSGLADSDFEEVLAWLFLQRPVLFEHFTMTTNQGKGDKSTSTIRRLVTGFMYEVMLKLSHLSNFDRYTTLYSNKIVSELINASTNELAARGSTALDSLLVEKLLRIFKLNGRHCVTLLRHYAQLPAEAFLGSQQSGNQRTFHYNQLCCALERLSTEGSSASAGNREHLTETIVRGLVRIYMECGRRLENDPVGLDDLEQALLAYLSTFTHNIAHVAPELMGVFFENRQRIGKPLVRLATFLLARDARFHGPFKALVGQHSSKKELVYPLLNVAFQRSLVTAATMLDSDEEKRLLMKLYGEYKGGIHKMLEKPHKAAVIYRENRNANESLVRLCMPHNECVDFARKKLRIEAVEVFQLRVLMEIYGNALETVKDDPKQQVVVYGNGFSVLLQCFEVLVRSSASAVHFLKRADAVVYLNEFVLALYGWAKRAKHHKALREMDFQGVTSSANWNTFCKTCLKFGIDMLQDEGNVRRLDDRLHVLPKIMAVLVDLFYANDNREQADIERYYDWALSHSLFLRMLLTQFHFKPKTSLVHLLYVLARKNPTVADRKHIPLLLGAYGATLSDCNRYILALLQVYERAGVQMHEFHPFLWGETAIKHFSLQADANGAPAADDASQCRRTSFGANPAEVFSLLAKDKVTATVQQFPVWRRLDACAQLPLVDFDDISAQLDADGEVRFGYQPASALEEFVEKEHRRRKYEKAPSAELLEMHAVKPEQRAAMYDPAFLVPLLGYLFAPEHEDMLNLAGKAGVIPLPFVCLASNDEQMRLAAGCVITRIRGHLEQTRKFIDVSFWLRLFSTVERGLSAMKEQAAKRDQKAAQLPKTPFLSASFIARTISVVPDVLNDLHGPLTRYIVLQDVFDFRAIPNFMFLFHSADVKHGVHRLFMLDTIYRGIQTHEDFGLLRASPVLRALMHFYASPLSNRELNVTILNMLDAITRIPKSCEALVNTLGFLAWLSQRLDGIESFHFDTIEAFLGILSNCWYAMHVMAVANAAASSRGQHQPQHGRVPVSFQRSVLIATLKCLPLLSTRSSSTTLIRFLNLLEKTTSGRYSNERLLALVSEPALLQMLEYFETLFGAHIWCVQYVRQYGTHNCDDDVTTGKKLRDSGADKMTLAIVLSLRRFVIRWHNFQKGAASAAGGALDAAEDELPEVQTEV